MDSTLQLKNSIISRIKSSSDIEFLKALHTIMDSSDKSLYQLSELQEQSIEAGNKDIQEGRFVSNEQVLSEIELWLKKK